MSDTKKIRVAVISYGNIGRFVVETIGVTPDMELAGVVRRSKSQIPAELSNIQVVTDIRELKDVDVAIICSPSRIAPLYAKEILSLGINTVDSFDIHTQVWRVRTELDAAAKAHEAVAILSAGWDPGSDSVVRALLQAMAPKGLTYTNFGPGMSMGHSVAAKAIEGVRDALSMTIPIGTGLHRRMVYVELEEGYSLESVAASIKADDYFAHDDTHVIAVESVDALKDMGHGVNLVRKGVSGDTHSQRFEFNMAINNPALTAQILVACARASLRQRAGAYTLIEIPPIDLLYGTTEELVKNLV